MLLQSLVHYSTHFICQGWNVLEICGSQKDFAEWHWHWLIFWGYDIDLKCPTLYADGHFLWRFWLQTCSYFCFELLPISQVLLWLRCVCFRLTNRKYPLILLKPTLPKQWVQAVEGQLQIPVKHPQADLYILYSLQSRVVISREGVHLHSPMCTAGAQTY